MLNSSFKIKRDVCGKNYYGLIELDIELASDGRPHVSFNAEGTDEKWHPVVTAGVLHFFNYYYPEMHSGLYIHVRKLHTMLGDTTPAIVFYVTVVCLENALNFKKGLVRLDEGNGMFSVMR